MNNNFLETNNFKFLVNYVFKDIKQKTNYDISKNPKYISIFKKLVQTINKENINKRVSKEHLNNLVIDKCVPFIIKQLNKDSNKNSNPMLANGESRTMSISNRPIATKMNNNNNNLNFSNLQLNTPNNKMPNIIDNISGIASRNGEKIDFGNKLKEFQENRDYHSGPKRPEIKSVNELMGVNTNDDEKIDFMKKMQEIQNERNYETQNDSMNSFQNNNNKQNIKNNDALKTVNDSNIEIDNNFLQQLYDNNQQPMNNMLNKLNNDNDEELNDNLLDSYQNNNNLQLNIRDSSEQNKMPEYESNIDNLKSNYDVETIENNSKDIDKNTFNNSGYVNKVPAHVLVLENDIGEGGVSEDQTASFQVTLSDPLKIDKPCDVFLEFINMQNLKRTSSNTEHLESVNCFALQIDEFPIKTYSNRDELKDKYIIPNDSYGKNDNTADANGTDAVNATSYNIKLKSNYMCTINPMTISSLNIKLYGYTNSSGFELLQNADGLTGKLILGIFFKKHR